MTTRSTTKKTLQNFHARNSLWQAFLKHSEDMDCSVDYLINEAMRLYATEHGFLEATGSGTSPKVQPPKREPVPTVSEKPSAKLPRPAAPSRPSTPAVTAPLQAQPAIPRPSGPVTLPRPGQSAGQAATPAVPVPRRPSAPPPPPPRPTGVTGSGTAPGDQARPNLTIIFQGRKIPIAQDQFIIGRGSKSSDLAIKDANISRKHAAVIYHNGAYYMKDLGSTNGVEFGGKPVDSKRIDEGDVFTICGYDVHFTYSA